MRLSPPKYVTGVGKHYWQQDLVLSQRKHPAVPPYVRRQVPEVLNDRQNPYWPTPGSRVRWWMSFQQVNMPIETGNFLVFHTWTWVDRIWDLEWQVDGDPPVHGGTGDKQVDVAILSTDTAAEVAQKTFDALDLAQQDWSNYREGNLLLVTVTDGSTWQDMGLPNGPAIIWTEPTCRPTPVPGEHMVEAGIFTHGGPPLAHPNLPVLWYPVLSSDELEGMLDQGQYPVYTFPARFGLNYGVLPMGDDLPNDEGFNPEPL